MPIQPNLISNERFFAGGDTYCMLEANRNLFHDMALPDGVDSELVIAAILHKYGATPLQHPDPNYMQAYIGYWSKRQLPIFTKLFATTHLQYNPIENYDRTEVSTDSRTIKSSAKTEESRNEDASTEHKVSAENSDEYQPDSMDSGTTESENVLKSSGDSVDTNKRESKISGNIGVTTTQQMIAEERNIVTFDIYSYIAERYKDEFCLYVY